MVIGWQLWAIAGASRHAYKIANSPTSKVDLRQMDDEILKIGYLHNDGALVDRRTICWPKQPA